MGETAQVHAIGEVKPQTEYIISLVPPEHCSSIWRDVRKHLSSAVDMSGGRWSMEYLLAALVSNEQNLWIAYDDNKVIHGALTTQLVTYPSNRMMALHFLGGEDFDGWYKEMLDQVTSFAKKCGCEGLETVARKGFWKWFEEDGFEREAAFYDKKF
jgi:hypothetical protein